MERLILTIGEDQAGRRVDSLLRRELAMAPGYISALKFRERGILLNGAAVNTNARVSPGDVLSACIDDAPGGNPAEPMAAALHFPYEDEFLAVLDKAAGMAVHGSLRGGACTVANALAAAWGPAQAFHPVNRLDRGTSGLMVIARSAYIHDRLRRQLHTEAFRREYLAVARGEMSPPGGSICLPIGRGEGVRRQVDENGQSARTDYTVLFAGGGVTLLRLRLYTGRTHQIRLHLAAVGHPLLGDALYGEADERLSRPALHSAAVRFLHPVTGRETALTSPLPAELRALLPEDCCL